MEQILTKLVSSLADPVNLVLLLWIWWFVRDRVDLLEINTKLLNAQQDRGETLTKIVYMIDTLLKDSRREG
jgi:hypothetical protein